MQKFRFYSRLKPCIALEASLAKSWRAQNPKGRLGHQAQDMVVLLDQQETGNLSSRCLKHTCYRQHQLKHMEKVWNIDNCITKLQITPRKVETANLFKTLTWNCGVQTAGRPSKWRPPISSIFPHFKNLLPGFPVRNLSPPPVYILPGSKQVSLVSWIHQVVPIRQVWKISKRKFISSQKPSLSKLLLVNVKHFRQLIYVLLYQGFVYGDTTK